MLLTFNSYTALKFAYCCFSESQCFMEAKEITFATADCHLVLYVVNTEYEINPVIAENRSLL